MRLYNLKARLLGHKAQMREYEQSSDPMYQGTTTRVDLGQRLFTSFAVGNFDMAQKLRKLEKMAVKSGWFDKVTTISDEQFGKNILGLPSRSLEFVYENRSRGFGYWLWKPYLMRYVLNNAPENSNVIYGDVGNELSPNGQAILNTFFSKSDKYEGLFFSMPFMERQWTKRILLDRFKKQDRKSGQISATFFIMKSCPRMKAIVDEWIFLSELDDFILLNDEYKKEHWDLIQHRNDQSILSFLVKKHGLFSEPQVDSFNRALYSLPGSWVHKYPIHTVRTRGTDTYYNV